MNQPSENLSGNCKRFQDLIESHFAGERRHSQVDEAWLNRHGRECSECAEYMNLISSLTQVDDDSRDDLAEREAIRLVVDTAFRRRSTKKWYLIAAAAAIVLILGGIAVFASFPSSESVAPGGRFHLLAGSLQIADRIIVEGERFDQNENNTMSIGQNALVAADGALFVALKSGSLMGVIRSEPREIRLRLVKGRMAIHLRPGSNIGLTIDVPDGTVSVVGTVLIVEVNEGVTQVDVVKGEVQVASTGFEDQSPWKLPYGYMLVLSEKEKRPRIPRKNDSLLELLGVSQNSEERLADNQLEAPPTMDGDLADLSDGDSVDKAPDESGSRASSTTESRSYGGLARANLPGSNMALDDPTSESLKLLLKKARSCRASKDWRCAEDSYREIITSYSKLPDATTAMVPLAQILLEHSNRKEEALSYFGQYIARRPGGGLAPEAEWGRCNTLRKLRRYGEEQRCLRAFLDKYPDSLNAPIAQYRLEEI